MKGYIYFLSIIALTLFSANPIIAQNISYEVNGTNLGAEEDGNGCVDCPCFISCSSDADPRWRVRINDNSNTSWSYWSKDTDNNSGCFWYGYSNSSWRNQTNTSATSLTVQLDAWEADAFGCGSGDDGDCGGYGTVRTVTIKNKPPCTSHSFTDYRYCTSDGDKWQWGVQWEYEWEYYNTNGSYDKVWYGWNSDWNDPKNWNGCSLPTTNDDVYIPNTSNNPIVKSGVQAKCNTIDIDSDNAEVTIRTSNGANLKVDSP